LLQSNKKEKTSKEIKDELVNKVNPKNENIKIKGIGQTKTNSIVMESDTRSDLQKFKEHSKLVSLEIEEPNKRNLLMILYVDIDSLLTANELKENIKQQNLDELSIEEEDIVPRFKTGSREKPTIHWIIQMGHSKSTETHTTA